MQNALLSLFPPSEREKIDAAVREAERVTSGEIVPYVVGQSDHYETAEWRAGFLAWFVAFIAMALLPGFRGEWTRFDPVAIAPLTLLAGGAGMLAVRLSSPLKRMFAGSHLIARRVEQRAAEAFISEEVFATPKRTGILIFLSLLERRVLVMGDAGINSKVAADDWHGIIRLMVEAIGAGKPADGLVEGIRQCGTLLSRHGINRAPGERDELPDGLRIRKE